MLLEETGIVNVADPLGGSWYVEELTDRIEAEAEEIFAQIQRLGGGTTMTAGVLRGIEDGWFMAEIAEAAFAYQVALEKGDKKIVGVTGHTVTVTHELEIMRVAHQVETDQVAALAARKAARDDGKVQQAIAAMVAAARTEANLVPPMLDAVRAEATLGEICDALRGEWGEYREPARF